MTGMQKSEKNFNFSKSLIPKSVNSKRSFVENNQNQIPHSLSSTARASDLNDRDVTCA